MKVISQKTIETHVIKLLDIGILTIHNTDKKVQTVEDQKVLRTIIGSMTNQQRIPILHTFDQFSLPSKEVRNFWASNDTCLYSKADAFIISSLGQKIMGDFYLKIEKPSRPTKLFSNKAKAIEWLKNFILIESKT